MITNNMQTCDLIRSDASERNLIQGPTIGAE